MHEFVARARGPAPLYAETVMMTLDLSKLSAKLQTRGNVANGNTFLTLFYLEDDDDATLAMGQMTEQFECMRSMQPAEDLNCANKDCHSCKCHSASRWGGFPNLI